MSLTNHDGKSLDCGHYISDIFDTNTGIWWHRDDGNITQIRDLPKGVYIRDSHKKRKRKKLFQAQYMSYFLFISEQSI